MIMSKNIDVEIMRSFNQDFKATRVKSKFAATAGLCFCLAFPPDSAITFRLWTDSVSHD